MKYRGETIKGWAVVKYGWDWDRERRVERKKVTMTLQWPFKPSPLAIFKASPQKTVETHGRKCHSAVPVTIRITPWEGN